jgi:hypothetical protein
VSAGWIAGSTRARLLLTRRLGIDRAREIAAADGLAAGAAGLAATRRFAAVGVPGDLETAQRAVAECLLLELRVLAGWLPAQAGELMRTLAGWFELVNVEDRLAYLAGGGVPQPLALGALTSAWPRAEQAQTPGELRAALRDSVWGDPGGESVEAIHLALRLAWGRRLARVAPEARAWVAGALALVVARERFLAARPGGDIPASALGDLGPVWAGAGSVADLRARLPVRASWPLAGVSDPADLWRAEAGWWRRVRGEAEALVHSSPEGQPVVVGVVALLAADAALASAALACSARPGAAAQEAFDALA